MDELINVHKLDKHNYIKLNLLDIAKYRIGDKVKYSYLVNNYSMDRARTVGTILDRSLTINDNGSYYIQYVIQDNEDAYCVTIDEPYIIKQVHLKK